MKLLTILAGIVLSAVAVVGITYKAAIPPSKTPLVQQKTTGENGAVLAAQTSNEGLAFNIIVPANFGENAVFEKDVEVKGTITSPGLIKNLTAGDGISVTSGATPKITNTGVSSLQSKTGALTLEAGSGISISGLKITNSGITSLSAGDGISVDGNKITNTRTADYSLSGWTDGGSNIYLTTSTDSVGIGTSSPSTKLHVVGSTTLAGAVTLGSATSDAITFTGRLANGTSFIPNTDLGSDLGSSSYRFNNLWVANINSNSSQAFSGQTTFSYAPTDTTITQASVIINPTSPVANGQLLAFGVAGYQRALVDVDGDLIIGYNDATSAPTTAYPFNVYGHSATRVVYIDTSGNIVSSGSLDINGTSNDIAGTLNLSGNALTSSGALTITPNAGSNLNVALSTTGDFAVNTNQLYVDTSTGYVGIGTTNPNVKLHVYRPGIAGGTTFRIGEYSSAYYGDFTYDANGSTTLSILTSVSGGAIRFVQGSSVPLYIAGTSGNVGIGTTGPLGALDIRPSGSQDALRIYSSGGSLMTRFDPAGSWIDFGATIYAPYVRFGTQSNLGSQVGIQSDWTERVGLIVKGTSGQNANLQQWQNSSGTSLVVIDNAGNVGIGTSVPNQKLYVNGNIYSDNFITSNGGYVGMTSYARVTFGNDLSLIAGGAIHFNPSSSEKMRLGSNGGLSIGSSYVSTDNGDGNVIIAGNVGIGTTAPGAKLQVNGSYSSALKVYGTDTVGAGIVLDATGSSGKQYIFMSTGSGAGAGAGVFSVYNATDNRYDWTTLSSGHLNLARNFYTDLAQFTVIPTSSTVKGQVIRAAASQVANLLEWQNSAGTGLGAIDAAGNVGIGTTSPGETLDIVGSIRLKNPASSKGFYATDANGSGARGLDLYNYGVNLRGFSTYPIQFTTNSSERMRISGTGGLSFGSTYVGTDPGDGNVIISGNVGIGTTGPGAKLEIQGTGKQLLLTGGTLAVDGSENWLKVTGTLPAATSNEPIGALFDITGAGNQSRPQVALESHLNAGYTGGNYTSAGYFYNTSAGTGTTPFNIVGNFGAVARSSGTTAGTNAGLTTYVNGGNINYGVFSNSTIAKNSAKNIGVAGFGLNTGTSPTQIGGFFGLMNSEPTYESAALIADNGSQTSPIFLARDNGSTVFTINDGGNVGIGTTGPSSKLDIGSSDLGDGAAGPVITLGRNTNATNTGAGSINFLSKAGTAGYVWQDATGVMRINTAAPTNANDTAGTVIGAQTSSLAYKNMLGEFTDYSGALTTILDTPLFNFSYKSGAFSDSSFTGIITDYSPTFGMDNGKSLNVISGLGYTFGAIKELSNQISKINDQKYTLNIKNEESTKSATFVDLTILGKLEAQGAVTFKSKVEFLDLVIFKAIARFKELFADKTHQKELCVGEETNETCITKDKLDELMKLLPSPTPTPSPSASQPVGQATPTTTPTIAPSQAINPTPTISPTTSPTATPSPITSQTEPTPSATPSAE